MTSGHTDPLAGWGGPADLSAWEAVMWRAEGEHRTRSTGVLIEILDQEPDWVRLVSAHDRLTRAIPRMRERIIEPLLPVGAPVWSPDPHFDLDYHFHRVRLPGDGSTDELHSFISQFAGRPLDPQRPPWEAVLVSGLAGGRAAYLFKPHHSLTDGLGLLQLLYLTHGLDREPGPHTTESPSQPRPVATPAGLLADRLTTGAIRGPARVLRGVLAGVDRLTDDPLRTAVQALRFGDSLRRVLAPVAAPRSPILRHGGPGYRLITLDVPFADVKAAGQAAGGSVNDAFLAAVLGAIRRYHEKLSLPVDVIPMAIPISLRTDADPMGGNKFAGARFAAPVGERDPAARIAAIHRFIADARTEPALGFLDLLAPALSALPGSLLTRIAGEMTGAIDVQASNMGAVARPLYLAGARVVGLYPMGPRPGVAAMVTMLSYDENCCVTVNFDPEAITDARSFSACLHEGFDEVLAIAQSCPE
jgi:diacylglycerol O-acyltransferase